MDIYLKHEDRAMMLLDEGYTLEETLQALRKEMKTTEAVCALARLGFPMQETAYADYIQEPSQ